MFRLLENLSMTEEYRFVRHWKILIFYLRLQEIIKYILLLIYLNTFKYIPGSVSQGKNSFARSFGQLNWNDWKICIIRCLGDIIILS